MRLISVPEMMIRQQGQEVVVGRMTSVINADLITSIRAVGLPGDLKGADGNPIPKPGTQVQLGADRVLVELCDSEFFNLLDVASRTDTGGCVLHVPEQKIVEKDLEVTQQEEGTIIKFPGKG